MEEYGIDKLKEVILTFIQFGVKFEDVTDEDSPKGRKIALTEWFELGVFIVPKAIAYASDIEQIRNEFNDLSGAETDELVAFVAEKLDLENDAVEELIETVFVWADSTNDLRLAIKGVVKK